MVEPQREGLKLTPGGGDSSWGFLKYCTFYHVETQREEEEKRTKEARPNKRRRNLEVKTPVQGNSMTWITCNLLNIEIRRGQVQAKREIVPVN